MILNETQYKIINGKYYFLSLVYGYQFAASSYNIEQYLFIRSCYHANIARNWRRRNIRKTYPCDGYPLIPHFYIAKLGYAGVYLFFLFLLQNIDCVYSLEPPRRGGSKVYPQSMFWAKIRKITKKFQQKIVNFLSSKISVYYCMG